MGVGPGLCLLLRIPLPRTPVNKAVENVDNRCMRGVYRRVTTNAKTPDPRVAPGGGGPILERGGPWDESPASASWRRA